MGINREFLYNSNIGKSKKEGYFVVRNEIIENIKNILLKYKIEEAYLFGSFARGDYNKFSDIDIAVKCEDLNKYFELIEDFVNEAEKQIKEIL